jgi:chemosensory pili system protein ChpA (sensor histidine kinase/response regulator)
MSISALTPFLSEMRRELSQTAPDLERWIATLSTAAGDDPALMDALEEYATQLERIGQTAELIGMPGLSTWCAALSGILPGVAFLEGDARAQACKQLAIWPALVDAYLQKPAELDASMELVEYLSSPSFGQTADEGEGRKLLIILTTQPVVPEELMAQLAKADEAVSVTSADVSLAVSDTVDPEVYNAFIDEAPNNLEEFAALTSKIAAGSADASDMRSAKRIAHSFKGSANIVGIRGIAALGHHTEDVLEYFEQNPVKPPRALGQALVAASDCLAQMVGYLRGDESAPENSLEVLNEIVAWVNKVKSGEIENMTDDAVVEVAPAGVRTEVSPAQSDVIRPDAPAKPAQESEAQATLRVPVNTVDEMYRLIGEMTTKIARLESLVANVTGRAKSLLAHNQVVQQRVVDIEKLVMLRGMSLTPADAGENESFDPLEMDRYNELHGATRALVEATADTREMTDNLEAGVTSLRIEVTQQSQINKELQHQVVSTRLSPVNSLVARLTRNVRQTCMQTGKQADLVISGGDIHVDGDVLNKLADPLLHLLRNAVDHGIELPEDRIAAGKPADGRIDLNFARQGSGIVVTIRDDGKGLDYDAIRTKAIDRQLIDEDQQLTNAELARLILLPGFSTRDQVSEISGRGVGMDVVATQLANIKGTVELSSVPGHGCEIILRFQASLVTQHTLLVEAGKQLFAIPIHYIREAFPGDIGQIRQLSATGENFGGASTRGTALSGHSAESNWQFTIRDESFPLHDLAPLTGYRSPRPSAMGYSAKPKLLIRTADGVMAVLVDRVVESRSVMVKTMGKYLSKVHGVSGVTLMGDGALVPLLNVPELLVKPVAITAAAADLAATARLHTRRILVVDDSLSVRKGLMQLFQDAAYEVKGAGDGMEAIRVLESFQPHLVCTDMEMPNMNGLELTQHLRMKESTRHLPVIMITSRSMDKHREQAMQAGVSIYVTKPYTETALLQHVHDALQTPVRELAPAG